MGGAMAIRASALTLLAALLAAAFVALARPLPAGGL